MRPRFDIIFLIVGGRDRLSIPISHVTWFSKLAIFWRLFYGRIKTRKHGFNACIKECV